MLAHFYNSVSTIETVCSVFARYVIIAVIFVHGGERWERNPLSGISRNPCVPAFRVGRIVFIRDSAVARYLPGFAAEASPALSYKTKSNRMSPEPDRQDGQGRAPHANGRV